MSAIDQYDLLKTAIVNEAKKVIANLDTHDRNCGSRFGSHNEKAVAELRRVFEALESINNDLRVY